MRGLVAEVAVTGPYPADMDTEKPEIKTSAKWQVLHAEPNGTLNLATAFATPKTPAVYLRAYVFSPKGQSVTITTSGESRRRMWVNDRRPYPMLRYVFGPLRRGECRW